jgi:hypothetical protein
MTAASGRTRYRPKIDGPAVGSHAVRMIRLTLPDGTRIQLEASEITDVEPVAGGALVHRAVGDPIKVMQNARTIQTRINAELDTVAAEQESDETPITVADEAVEIAASETTAPPEPNHDPSPDPRSRVHRLKRLMAGRVSGTALAIGQWRNK